METQRLPRALKIKSKVDQGEILDQHDIEFLKMVFKDANKLKPLLDRHPEFDKLVAQIISLYNEIMDKAVENEKNN